MPKVADPVNGAALLVLTERLVIGLLLGLLYTGPRGRRKAPAAFL